MERDVAEAGHDADTSLRDLTLMGLSLVAIAAFYIYFCWASERPWDRDSIVRSMYVQRALEQPWRLVDPWARPLGVIPYLAAAIVPTGPRAGFAVAKAMSCAYSVLGCLFIALAARDMKIRHCWVAAIALAAQPVVCQMSAGVQPVTVFVAVFALALWCHARGRVRTEVLCYSLLPLARLENVVLFAPAALYLLFHKRRPWLLLLLAAPTVLWYVLMAWLRSDALWIVAHAREMTTVYPLSLDRDLKWGASAVDPLHYFYLAPRIFGLAVVFLVAVRLLRRWDMLSLYLVSMVGVHCWLKGRAGHTGYPRHIMPVAPLLALFAAQGLAHLEAGLERWRALVLRVAAIAAMSATCLWTCRPLRLEQPAAGIQQQAAQYVLAHGRSAPHLTSQPWIDYFLDRNWCDHARLSWDSLNSAAVGTYVLWDPTAEMADHQVEYSTISLDARFRKIAEFPPRKTGWRWLFKLRARPSLGRPKGYAVVVFKKVSESLKD